MRRWEDSCGGPGLTDQEPNRCCNRQHLPPNRFSDHRYPPPQPPLKPFSRLSAQDRGCTPQQTNPAIRRVAPVDDGKALWIPQESPRRPWGKAFWPRAPWVRNRNALRASEKPPKVPPARQECRGLVSQPPVASGAPPRSSVCKAPSCPPSGGEAAQTRRGGGGGDYGTVGVDEQQSTVQPVSESTGILAQPPRGPSPPPPREAIA